MTTQQIESFIAVAENLNFAKAAETLNLTQSAVSRQIQSLENELGAPLFLRTSRSVSLTPAGFAFLDEANKIVKSLHYVTEKIRRHTSENIQLFNIGLNTEAEWEGFSNALSACREKLPEMHPIIRIIPHRAIVNIFLQGEVDVLFGYKDDVPAHGNIVYKELAKLDICCAVSSRHPLAKKKCLDEQALYSENIIICNSFPVPQKIISIQKSIERRLPLESLYFCDDPYAQLMLVEAGYGIAIISRSKSSDGVQLVPLANAGSVSYGFFYRKDNKNSIMKKFISIVMETL